MKKLVWMFLVIIFVCSPLFSISVLAAPPDGSSTETSSSGISSDEEGKEVMTVQTTGSGDITKSCTYVVSSNKKTLKKAIDKKLYTNWTMNKGKNRYMQINMPVIDKDKGIYLQWSSNLTPWECFVVTDGGEISIAKGGDEFYAEWIKIPEEYKSNQSFIFRFKDGSAFSLAEISVFAGGIPGYVPQWQKYDGSGIYALVFVCHPDDDTLYFAAFIAYCREAGLEVVIVYMAVDSGRRRLEAQEGAWIMGEKIYPVMRMKNPHPARGGDKIYGWSPKQSVEFVVEQIRKYKPEIVVTHDPKGEYGHVNHKRTFNAVNEAVLAAGDATKFTKSVETYGVWTPSAFYVHLYGQNKITFDIYKKLDAFGGKTAFEIASDAFGRHFSQHNGHHTVQRDGVDKWPMANFGRYWIDPNIGIDPISKIIN